MQVRVSPAFKQPTGRHVVLALGLLLAVAASGCGAGMTPEYRAALAKVQELGGKVNFEKGGYRVDLSNGPVEDNDLVFLKDIPKLTRINLQGTQVSDAGIDHLVNLKTLEIVGLERSAVTKAGADKLRAALPEADIRHQ